MSTKSSLSVSDSIKVISEKKRQVTSEWVKTHQWNLYERNISVRSTVELKITSPVPVFRQDLGKEKHFSALKRTLRFQFELKQLNLDYILSYVLRFNMLFTEVTQ